MNTPTASMTASCKPIPTRTFRSGALRPGMICRLLITTARVAFPLRMDMQRFTNSKAVSARFYPCCTLLFREVGRSHLARTRSLPQQMPYGSQTARVCQNSRPAGRSGCEFEVGNAEDGAFRVVGQAFNFPAVSEDDLLDHSQAQAGA